MVRPLDLDFALPLLNTYTHVCRCVESGTMDASEEDQASPQIPSMEAVFTDMCAELQPHWVVCNSRLS